MVTVLPGSAVPVTVVPSAEITTFSGASGGVLSGASAKPDGLVLPLPSVAVTSRASPLVWAGEIGMVKVPSGPAVAWPMIVPSGALIIIVLFGSAVPLTLAPSSATTRLPGVAGAVMSAALTSAGELWLPAASEATTEMISPFTCAGFRLAT
ncbi:Uncharacterised protein [Enterobacter hormaechei]|nr:Uncharacterised protein [Enterobacter hormaechei]